MLDGLRHVNEGCRPAQSGNFGLRQPGCDECGLSLAFGLDEIEDAHLGLRVGHVDADMKQEPVKLGFGQRECPLVFQRVLGRDDKETGRQTPCLSASRHLSFGHRLEKRRLHFRRGAIDFVDEQQRVEDRAGQEIYLAGIRIEDLRAGDVGGHQVGCALNAGKTALDTLRQAPDGTGFGQTGRTLYQDVPAGKQRNHQALHKRRASDQARFDFTHQSLCCVGEPRYVVTAVINRLGFGHSLSPMAEGWHRCGDPNRANCLICVLRLARTYEKSFPAVDWPKRGERMSLRSGLILGLCLVTALVLFSTVIWAMTEARDRGARQLGATLARVSAMIERNYQMMPDEPASQHIRRTTMDVMQVLTPGTCVVMEETRISKRMFCSDWQVFGRIAPGWFYDIQQAFFGTPEGVVHEGQRNTSDTYRAEVFFDPVAFATSSWGQVRLAVRQALVMAAGVLVLGTVLILRSTRSVQPIVSVLGALTEGRLDARVRPNGFSEFRTVGGAVNALAERLDKAENDRKALTRQLLLVEDAERRHLARDLHDEFGQILTATGALAGGIERRAGQDEPEIAQDARSIRDHVARMMETLRGAFASLRPPELDELGLSASLRQMIGGWAAARGGRVRFDLDLATFDEVDLSPEVALGVYRIAQEAITNAMRHGAPKLVAIRLSGACGTALELTIEDDGGGRIGAPDAGRGSGILGITERVETLGGRLSIDSTGSGIRVAVNIPPVRSEVA